ncbi:rho GTPase-activating protein 19 [Anomaloglossus baeobatrachus]
MAATEDAGDREKGITRESLCNIVICNDAFLRSQPVIYNPDFFVEKLRHENPDLFTELLVSNITRLIDLPGTEFAELMGEVDPKLPGPNGAAASFFKSLNFLKRKAVSTGHMDHKAREEAWLTKINQVFSESSEPVFNVETEENVKMVGRLKQLLNQKTRLWWNMTFMERYIQKGLIPRGLRVQLFPSFDIKEDSFKKEWEEASSICSMTFMKLLVGHNASTLKEVELEINIIQGKLVDCFSKEKLASLNADLDKDFSKWEKEITGTKTRKYQRDLSDYKNVTKDLQLFARKLILCKLHSKDDMDTQGRTSEDLELLKILKELEKESAGTSSVSEDLRNLKRSTVGHNLPLRHKKAIEELKSLEGIVIKPADKGGNVVIWPTDMYEREAFRQLRDHDTYTSLSGNPIKGFESELEAILEAAFQRVETLPSFVRDTSDVLRRINGISLDSGVLLVTVDVETLYSCIRHCDVQTFLLSLFFSVTSVSSDLRTEGLFRIPGNSNRLQILKDSLNSGVDIDVDSGEFHPNDVATLLKMFLGELPEPLLTHRHYHAHLKIADLMLFDDKGNRTGAPDKERQIEVLQLLFLLLPSSNRNLLKLLLDLLYQTAKKQDRNKMSAHNLALMFAPHIIWPKNVTANDLQEHIINLTNGVTFMIKHSQKLFKAPAYIREYARLHFSGSKTPTSKDDLELLSSQTHNEFKFLKSQKRSRLVSSPSSSTSQQELTQRRTEEALRELFQHVHHMPDSAKKKKLIRQFNKHNQETPDLSSGKKHVRSRSFSGMIKRKVLGGQAVSEKKRTTPLSMEGSKHVKENSTYASPDSPAAYFTKAKLKLSESSHSKKEACSKLKRPHLLATQETSI